MSKRIRRNWKRLLSLILTLALIGTGCNVCPVQAAISEVYSNGFEEAADVFGGLGGANAQLSSALKQTSGDSKTDNGTSSGATLTKKVTFKKEAGGWTDAFVDLKALLPGTTKDVLSKYQSAKVVISVDKVEADPSGEPVSKLYFQPNATWNWCPGDEVKLAANTDYTLTLPVSKINWGAGDTDTGAFGIQLANFKEGLEVTVTIKSFEMIKEKASISSMAAYLKSGSAEVKYEKQYDVTSANIDLTTFLPSATKDDIMKHSAIEVVMNVTSADAYTSDRKPTATVFSMGDKTWVWGVGASVPIKAREDVTVTIPTENIKWGVGDTGLASGGFGVQLNNLKEGTVDYNIVSVKFVDKNNTDSSKDSKPAVKDIGTAKSGSNFLYVSGRSSVSAGVCADFSNYMSAGNIYKINAWVKNVDKEADFIKLNWSKTPVSGGILIGSVKAVQGEWTKIEAYLEVPKSAKKVFLKFVSANTNNDFGIDDVVITEVDNGETTQIKNYTVKEKDVKDGAVTLQGKVYNNLTIDASVGDANVVLKNVTVVGKLKIFSSQASKVELYDTVVNKFDFAKSEISSSSIKSLSTDKSIPTIVLGAGSNLLSFLAGADVELTQDEKSVLNNIVVNPGKNGEIEIVLKDVKCNLVINSDPSSKINFKLENAQLNDVQVSSVISGGQVDFSGDTSSKITNLNMQNGSGITSTINTPVQNLNVQSDNAIININSKVDKVKLEGDQGALTVGKNAAVGTLTADGDKTKITSDGNIGTMEVNGNKVSAKVDSKTKVDIKKGTEGASVSGSSNVKDNNIDPTPAPLTPTPIPVKATTNVVLAQNVAQSYTAVKDPKYNDACVMIKLNDYFSKYLTRSNLDSYKRIEIKLTVDNVTNYSDTNKGKVTVYSMGQTYNWSEYDQPPLASNKEVTITVDTDKIAYGNGNSLYEIGLKFSQFAPNTTFNLTIASIKLIASDTAQDEKPKDKETSDLVVLSTAKTGTATIKDEKWSGVGGIDFTSYLTADSKLKSTIDKYNYLEVKLTLGDFNAFTGQTPQAKLYTKDSATWEWADGAETNLVKNGTVTIKFPVSKIVWGKDGKATTLGEAGLQLYWLAPGQTLNYTIESIKLLAPSAPSPSDITGDYVELKDQGTYTAVNLDLISKLTDKTRATVDKYNYITVDLDINKILLKGTTPATAVIYVQDNQNWVWKTSSSVAVEENKTLTIQIPTKDIIWGNDGKSLEIAALGVQFGSAGAGTKIGYSIKSVAPTGLKDTNPSSETGASITGDYVELKDQGTYTAVNLDLISKLTDKTRATVDKYNYITVDLDINKILLNGTTPATAVIYVQDNQNWVWKTSSSVAVEENKTLTIQIPTKDIIWGNDGKSLEIAALGVQFGSAGAGTKIGYSIKSVALTGLKDGGTTDPSAASGSAVTGTVIIASSVTGSASATEKGEVNVNLSNLFSSDKLQKSYMMQNSNIELKFKIDNYSSIDTSKWPGGFFFIKTGDKWSWSDGGWTGVNADTITFSLPTSKISWESGEGVKEIGFYVANLPVGTTINYTIDSLTLKK